MALQARFPSITAARINRKASIRRQKDKRDSAKRRVGRRGSINSKRDGWTDGRMRGEAGSMWSEGRKFSQRVTMAGGWGGGGGGQRVKHGRGYSESLASILCIEILSDSTNQTRLANDHISYQSKYKRQQIKSAVSTPTSAQNALCLPKYTKT